MSNEGYKEYLRRQTEIDNERFIQRLRNEALRSNFVPTDARWERIEIPVSTDLKNLLLDPTEVRIKKIKKEEKSTMNLKIRSMLYNSKKNVTTVVFEDGDVRMVKRDKKDKHDPYLAVAMCVASKVCKSKTAFKKLVDKTLKQI